MVVDSPPEETVALANTWRLSSVERASMTEQVLRELREAIVEGRIPQGEPLRGGPHPGGGAAARGLPGGDARHRAQRGARSRPPAHPGGPGRLRAPPRRLR